MTAPIADEETLRSLPKAELHLHLDGSIRVATAVQLGSAAGIELSEAEAPVRLIAPPRGRSQAELLAYFALPISLLQSHASLERVASELVEDLASDGVRYAEIRWAPRLHLEQGLSVAEVIEAVVTGVERARGSLGTRAPMIGLIVTAMRSHAPAHNVELARVAGDVGAPVVGFDLAGLEAEYPAPPHAAAFRAAEELGLALTVHAGEEPGVDRIRDAIGLGVRRIAHGVTAAAEAELIDLLRQRDVTLDMCPTSNVQAGIVGSLAEHPVAALHRGGVSVTLSTDDRTVSDLTLSDELARTAAALALTPDELAAIAVNGFRRAFSSQRTMAPLLADAERSWTAWARGADTGHPIS